METKECIEQKIQELQTSIEKYNKLIHTAYSLWHRSELIIVLNRKKEQLKVYNIKLEYYKEESSIEESIKPKYKKKTISLALKKLIWDKHIGLDIGRTKCVCCKTTEITQISFHAGHVIAESKGGETNVSNLKTICQNCNSSMGSINMDEFEKLFV